MQRTVAVERTRTIQIRGNDETITIKDAVAGDLTDNSAADLRAAMIQRLDAELAAWEHDLRAATTRSGPIVLPAGAHIVPMPAPPSAPTRDQAVASGDNAAPHTAQLATLRRVHGDLEKESGKTWPITPPRTLGEARDAIARLRGELTPLRRARWPMPSRPNERTCKHEAHSAREPRPITTDQWWSSVDAHGRPLCQEHARSQPA